MNTRESLAIEVDVGLSGQRVARVLDQIAETRGLPQSITVNNGPEFTSRALDAWAYQEGVSLAFIAPRIRLKEARLKKKLSRGDVAKILGVHRTYISGLERGVRNPSLLTVQKIAKAIGVKVKQLV